MVDPFLADEFDLEWFLPQLQIVAQGSLQKVPQSIFLHSKVDVKPAVTLHVVLSRHLQEFDPVEH